MYQDLNETIRKLEKRIEFLEKLAVRTKAFLDGRDAAEEAFIKRTFEELTQSSSHED